MKRPPLLPTEVLRKVLRMARFNGTVLLVVAGAFALGSASIHDSFGTVISLLIAGAGAMELHGAAQINHGEERGMAWMIGGQFYLMAVILAYVAFQLRHIDIETLRPMITADKREQILQAGYSVDDFLRLIYKTGYYTIAVATALYQGAMVIYYRRRRPAIAAALRGSDQE